MGEIFMRLMLLNLFEEGFLLGFILLWNNEKKLLSFKNVNILVLLSILSYIIQNTQYPHRTIRNFIGMVMYFIVIKIFYKYNNKKLILSILLGFFIILIIESTVVLPAILLFHFDMNIINKNIIINFLLLIPVYIVECLILILMYNFKNKKSEESQ